MNTQEILAKFNREDQIVREFYDTQTKIIFKVTDLMTTRYEYDKPQEELMRVKEQKTLLEQAMKHVIYYETNHPEIKHRTDQVRKKTEGFLETVNERIALLEEVLRLDDDYNITTVH